jgi:hypothetical protein
MKLHERLTAWARAGKAVKLIQPRPPRTLRHGERPGETQTCGIPGETARELDGLMRNWLATGGRPPGGKSGPTDPEMIQRLKSLGYAQ